MKLKHQMSSPFVYTVISGKGGVGKSMCSVNTATMLSKMGYKTAILDVDLGMANCATLINEPVIASVTDWISGDCKLEELPIVASGISLITAANEPDQTHLNMEVLMDALDQVLAYLKENHEFIIIDTPAGAGEMALWALDTSNVATLVLVDEPTAISDAYRLCKYIYNIDPEYNFATIVNFAENEYTAESTHNRFNTILKYFLNKQTHYLGFIPGAQSVKEAVSKQKTLLASNTEEHVLKELEFVAHNIVAFAASLQKKQIQTPSS